MCHTSFVSNELTESDRPMTIAAKTTELVTGAIERSSATNSTVHITREEIEASGTASQYVREDLQVECEDSVEANGIEEFWGTNESGNSWRVHVPVSAYW